MTDFYSMPESDEGPELPGRNNRPPNKRRFSSYRMSTPRLLERDGQLLT